MFASLMIIPNYTQLFVHDLHNDIHEGHIASYSPDSVRQRLRAQIHFSHTNDCPQIWHSH